ncbi:MAG: hypothetical protein IJ112_03150 [Oscillospiraceae bacterium]|nr:hypothetical protein [Oscillospiraceae bacterium]
MQEKRSYDPYMRPDQGAVCAKGVSRRIVVVPGEESSVYEQIIYVVRDDAARSGITAQAVLQEAQRCLLPQQSVQADCFSPEDDALEEEDHVSKVLFALSGVALALSGGLLMYWFFAI